MMSTFAAFFFSLILLGFITKILLLQLTNEPKLLNFNRQKGTAFHISLQQLESQLWPLESFEILWNAMKHFGWSKNFGILQNPLEQFNILWNPLEFFGIL